MLEHFRFRAIASSKNRTCHCSSKPEQATPRSTSSTTTVRRNSRRITIIAITTTPNKWYQLGPMVSLHSVRRTASSEAAFSFGSRGATSLLLNFCFWFQTDLKKSFADIRRRTWCAWIMIWISAEHSLHRDVAISGLCVHSSPSAYRQWHAIPLKIAEDLTFSQNAIQLRLCLREYRSFSHPKSNRFG